MRDIDFSELSVIDGDVIYLDATGVSQVTMPDAGQLFSGEFVRFGSDLIVQSDGAPDVRITDYFRQGEPADLLSPDGAILRGDLVERLAGPEAPGQYAQVGETQLADPIGQVESVEGTAYAQRTDGTRVQLDVGSQVYENDVVFTQSDSKVSVTFADGTIFSLASDSRMVLDELVYEVGGDQNKAVFDLIEGGFVFIAGEVAKTGDMDVNTPTATMGIRGTTVKVDMATNAGVTTVSVSLNQDPDGEYGEIELLDLDGNLIATITSSDKKWIISPVDGETQAVDRTAGDFADDADILADAAKAYALAYERVENGETFVELGTSSRQRGTQNPVGENQANPQNDGAPGDKGRNDLNDEPSGGNNNNTPDGLENETRFQTDEAPVVREVQDDSVTSGEDATIVVSVLANDTGDSLILVSATDGSNGTTTLNGDGTITYTPNENFSGVDSFSYTVSDGQGGSDTATVTVTVTPVNDAPVAQDDSAVTAEDGNVQIAVLDNDSDVDGNPLSVTQATAQNGTVVINPDGTLSYTPDADFNGTDTIGYTVSDGQGGSDTATVTVNVGAVNDAPVAQDDSAVTAEDGNVQIAVLDNDSDVDGNPLSVTQATAQNGTVVINPDGTLSYTPDADFNGTDTIGYTVSDGQGGSDTATVTVNVGAVNDAPVAQDDSAVTAEDGNVQIAVLDNDSDVDGNPLSVTQATAQNGTVVINPDGTLSYTPDADFNGTDTIGYTVSDGQGGSDTATVTVNVGAVNDAPVAQDDSAVTAEDSNVQIAVLDNDSDVDGNPLSVTQATAQNGTVVINPDGTLSYTPDADFNGTDTIGYTVSDGQGGSDTATVTVNVGAVNDAPVAQDDSA
ncbi:Ig-like domain-containing protein, partial [Roseovarius litorisediminis]|uniref:Ig-like domain-containing protein n=1 Tax=Roseovarius litorisediminis TaxID=1312363 RepID=UPI00111C1F56